MWAVGLVVHLVLFSVDKDDWRESRLSGANKSKGWEGKKDGNKNCCNNSNSPD